jgi:hypothetical protein
MSFVALPVYSLDQQTLFNEIGRM